MTIQPKAIALWRDRPSSFAAIAVAGINPATARMKAATPTFRDAAYLFV
jgi:hypothetical protein